LEGGVVGGGEGGGGGGGVVWVLFWSLKRQPTAAAQDPRRTRMRFTSTAAKVTTFHSRCSPSTVLPGVMHRCENTTGLYNDASVAAVTVPTSVSASGGTRFPPPIPTPPPLIPLPPPPSAIPPSGYVYAVHATFPASATVSVATIAFSASRRSVPALLGYHCLVTTAVLGYHCPRLPVPRPVSSLLPRHYCLCVPLLLKSLHCTAHPSLPPSTTTRAASTMRRRAAMVRPTKQRRKKANCTADPRSPPPTFGTTQLRGSCVLDLRVCVAARGKSSSLGRLCAHISTHYPYLYKHQLANTGSSNCRVCGRRVRVHQMWLNWCGFRRDS